MDLLVFPCSSPDFRTLLAKVFFLGHACGRGRGGSSDTPIQNSILADFDLPSSSFLREPFLTIRAYDTLPENWFKSEGCVPRSVEKERHPPLRHQSIISGGNLRVFENLAQTLVAVDAS